MQKKEQWTHLHRARGNRDYVEIEIALHDWPRYVIVGSVSFNRENGTHLYKHLLRLKRYIVSHKRESVNLLQKIRKTENFVLVQSTRRRNKINYRFAWINYIWGYRIAFSNRLLCNVLLVEGLIQWCGFKATSASTLLTMRLCNLFTFLKICAI